MCGFPPSHGGSASASPQASPSQSLKAPAKLECPGIQGKRELRPFQVEQLRPLSMGPTRPAGLPGWSPGGGYPTVSMAAPPSTMNLYVDGASVDHYSYSPASMAAPALPAPPAPPAPPGPAAQRLPTARQDGAGSAASSRVQHFEARIAELREEKARTPPGGRALQLHMEAATLEMDPELQAAREEVTREEAAVAAAEFARRQAWLQSQVAWHAEQRRVQEQAQVDAPRKVVRQRIAGLNATVMRQAEEIRSLLEHAAALDRQKQELGMPLIGGAIQATRLKTLALQQEEVRLRHEAAHMRQHAQEVQRQAAEKGVLAPKLVAASQEQMQSLEAEQAEALRLYERLAELREEEEDYLPAAHAASLALTEEAEKRGCSRDDLAAAVEKIEAKVELLTAERAKIQQRLACQTEDVQRRFLSVFAEKEPEKEAAPAPAPQPSQGPWGGAAPSPQPSQGPWGGMTPAMLAALVPPPAPPRMAFVQRPLVVQPPPIPVGADADGAAIAYEGLAPVQARRIPQATLPPKHSTDEDSAVHAWEGRAPFSPPAAASSAKLAASLAAAAGAVPASPTPEERSDRGQPGAPEEDREDEAPSRRTARFETIELRRMDAARSAAGLASVSASNSGELGLSPLENSLWRALPRGAAGQ